MKIEYAFLILLSTLCLTGINAQKSTKKIVLTGTVLSVSKQPIANAIVMIDNEKTNSATDAKGNYRIKVKPIAEKIGIFTFGHGVAEEPINGRTRIDFILNEADLLKQNAQNNDANDKQVNVGFGTLSQKNLLTPVSTIDGRGGKYAAYKDIFEILKGTAGVIVRGNSVQIEGPSSMFSSTEPLYVVDGLTVGALDGITPAMVESISVLKGSSTTIYGSRGGNGVILITLIK